MHHRVIFLQQQKKKKKAARVYVPWCWLVLWALVEILGVREFPICNFFF